MRLRVDFNSVGPDGSYAARAKGVKMGDFVVADDGEGTVFLAIVTEVLDTYVRLRLSERVVTDGDV